MLALTLFGVRAKTALPYMVTRSKYSLRMLPMNEKGYFRLNDS